MTTKIDPISCGVCGESLDEEPRGAVTKRNPCPACGSLTRRFSVQVYGSLRFREKFGLKQKRVGHKKPIYESIFGDDVHRASGVWNKLLQEIDRINDRYKKIVVNLEKGEVLRHCDEPLTKHVGRGSARSMTVDCS
jgi:hypothetical protein